MGAGGRGERAEAGGGGWQKGRGAPALASAGTQPAARQPAPPPALPARVLQGAENVDTATYYGLVPEAEGGEIMELLRIGERIAFRVGPPLHSFTGRLAGCAAWQSRMRPAA